MSKDRLLGQGKRIWNKPLSKMNSDARSPQSRGGNFDWGRAE